ncbi:hypothetical protein K431DRAFT_68047 [Polychaeton citri CBS 116435]|uniref:Uncharacterized protein n=1 Tax=Polychaeton citri CBS 116435 TaxID=1314669 RepID=A0A9P4Q9L4_9PEZI|nr:hypothetical protein K431DRAFT_68047 [Polychaeton citri CBS 116435]
MSRPLSGLASGLLRLSYIQTPDAQQVMYSSTTRIFTDPSHPLYLATRRRAASFDPNRLYFKLSWHPGSKRKAVVSSWAVRRVREAVRQELQKRGFGMTGEALAPSHTPKHLSGIANIKIAPDDRILKARSAEVKAAASTLVDSIQHLHAKSSHDRARSYPQRYARASWT